MSAESCTTRSATRSATCSSSRSWSPLGSSGGSPHVLVCFRNENHGASCAGVGQVVLLGRTVNLVRLAGGGAGGGFTIVGSSRPSKGLAGEKRPDQRPMLVRMPSDADSTQIHLHMTSSPNAGVATKYDESVSTKRPIVPRASSAPRLHRPQSIAKRLLLT